MIVILGPAPKESDNSGMPQRVMGIDRLFGERPRLYITFRSHPINCSFKSSIHDGVQVLKYNLDPQIPSHRVMIREFFDAADLIYAHSLLTVEPIVELLKEKSVGDKFVTDLHGVVPEEAALSGNLEDEKKFNLIERQTFERSALLVMVTQKMEAHYRLKYPDISFKSATIPIFLPTFLEDSSYMEPAPIPENGIPTVVYAGGMEAWQNVGLMLDTVEHVNGQFNGQYRFRFFSFWQTQFLEEFRRRNLEDSIDFGTVQTSQGMREEYQQAHYGFVLRSDVIVNRVACPTKLIEYLHYGVIPIVLSPDIGDFKELGYQYLTLDQVKNKELPDDRQRREMIRKNHDVARKIESGGAEAFNAVLKVLDTHKKEVTPLEFTLYQKLFARSGEWVLSEQKVAQTEHQMMLLGQTLKHFEDTVVLKDSMLGQIQIELEIAQRGLRYGMIKLARKVKRKLGINLS